MILLREGASMCASVDVQLMWLYMVRSNLIRKADNAFQAYILGLEEVESMIKRLGGSCDI